jgi:hypothetical protein
MKKVFLIILSFNFYSQYSFSAPALTVEKIFKIYDLDKNGLLNFKEHKKFLIDHSPFRYCLPKALRWMHEKVYFYFASGGQPTNMFKLVFYSLRDYRKIQSNFDDMENVLEELKSCSRLID